MTSKFIWHDLWLSRSVCKEHNAKPLYKARMHQWTTCVLVLGARRSLCGMRDTQTQTIRFLIFGTMWALYTMWDIHVQTICLQVLSPLAAWWLFAQTRMNTSASCTHSKDIPWLNATRTHTRHIMGKMSLSDQHIGWTSHDGTANWTVCYVGNIHSQARWLTTKQSAM